MQKTANNNEHTNNESPTEQTDNNIKQQQGTRQTDNINEQQNKNNKTKQTIQTTNIKQTKCSPNEVQ